MAELTITRRGVARRYTVPNDLQDVSVPVLKKAGMQGLRAVTVSNAARKLYTRGRADLGYGLIATITGQLRPLKTLLEFYEEFIAQGMSESEATVAARAWMSPDYRLQGAPKTQQQAEALTADLYNTEERPL